MKERILALMEKLEQSKFAPLLQFIKFGLVGVSNTLISYGIEMLCYYVLFVSAEFSGTVALLSRLGISATGEQVKVVVVTLLAFIISVTNSYYWNNRYVFRSGEKKDFAQHLKAYLKTVACYAITGVVLAPMLKLWLVEGGMPFWAASLLSLLVTIPLNFVMNKFWAFRQKNTK